MSRRRAFGGLLAVLPLVACADDPMESDRLEIKVVDETGRSVPGAVVEVGSGSRVLRWQTNQFGFIRVPDTMDLWQLHVRSIDDCPFVELQSGGASWLLQRDRDVVRLCRSIIPWKIVGEPGDTVGWRETVGAAGIRDPLHDRSLEWRATPSQQIRLDSQGRGTLAIPAILDPFRSSSALRITLRGISFRPGWWWLDPTDSVFHAPVFALGDRIRPEWALYGGLIWGGDTLRYSWGTPLVATRADGSRRTATIRRVDSVLAGTWDDASKRTFLWMFTDIEGAVDALVLDTGAGVERGVLLRRLVD